MRKIEYTLYAGGQPVSTRTIQVHRARVIVLGSDNGRDSLLRSIEVYDDAQSDEVIELVSGLLELEGYVLTTDEGVTR